MNHAKEELDKERKILQKKRPQLEKEPGAKQTKETKQVVKCRFCSAYVNLISFFISNKGTSNKI